MQHQNEFYILSLHQQTNSKKIEIMTNAETFLQAAIEKKNNGKLSEWAANFVSQFEGWSKKELKKLTYNQFTKLREIAKS